MIQYFPEVTGSLIVNGNLSVSGNVAVTGSLSGTSSLAANSQLLSGTGSVGFTTTGSFTATSSSLSSRTTQIENVYATTGSNSFRATQSITGSLTVTGQITAQTLNVQQVTSSIVFSSGSNTFGCDLNSRQTFTGSVIITGSLVVNTAGPELQVNSSGVIIGNLLTDNHSITGSLRVTGSGNHFIIGCNLALGSTDASHALTITRNSVEVGIRLTDGTNNTYLGLANTANNFANGSNAGDTVVRGSNGISFAPNNGSATSMRISCSGLVGINTTNFGERLNIGCGGAVAFQNSCNCQKWHIQYNSNDGLNFVESAVADFRLFLKAGGNVGIGINNPATLLDTTKNDGTGTLLNSTADVVARFGNCNINPGNHYSSGIQVFQGCGTLGSGFAAGFLVADNNTATAQQSNTVSLISPSSMTGGINLIAADTSAPIRMFSGGFTCERMRITSAGNVCIGSAAVSGEILRVTGCSCLDNYISVYSGTIQMFLDADKTNNAGIVGTQSGHPLILRTNGTNKLSISTGGVLDFPGSNSTATSASDTLSFGVSSTTYAWIQSWGGRPLRINELGNNVNAYGTNGYGLVNTTASDVRIKKNIVSIENALDKVNCLRGVYYEFDENNSMCMKVPSGKRRVGLIAQEVACILPEALLESQDDSTPISLDYSGMIGLLTKAIQEQQCTINTLKTCIGIA